MSEIWPVYAGKSFDLWNPDTRNYYDSVDAKSITAYLQAKRLRQRQVRSSAFAELDPSITDDPATLPCRHPRIAFRNLARATDTRTLIAALVPGNRVVLHHAPFLLCTEGGAVDEAYLLGVLCSMPLDWQARRTVELNVTFEQINLLTIPDPGQGHPVRDRIAIIAGRLAATDERFADWAADVGVAVSSANDLTIKQDLLAELDACVAYLYGLDEENLAVVYQTFHEKTDYTTYRNAVLAHFRRIA